MCLPTNLIDLAYQRVMDGARKDPAFYVGKTLPLGSNYYLKFQEANGNLETSFLNGLQDLDSFWSVVCKMPLPLPSSSKKVKEEPYRWVSQKELAHVGA